MPGTMKSKRPLLMLWTARLGADSEERREPVRDINTAAVDSLKVLDPNRPIREADMARTAQFGRK
jgi:hypothetical protein